MFNNVYYSLFLIFSVSFFTFPLFCFVFYNKRTFFFLYEGLFCDIVYRLRNFRKLFYLFIFFADRERENFSHGFWRFFVCKDDNRCMHVSVCVCVRTSMCIYIHIIIYIHTHCLVDCGGDRSCFRELQSYLTTYLNNYVWCEFIYFSI